MFTRSATRRGEPIAAFTRCGSAACVTCSRPWTFSATILSHSSAGASSASPSNMIPALLTSVSRRPSSLTACSTTSRACRWSVTSAGAASAVPPASRIVEASSASRSPRRATRATAAPSAASLTAVAAPIPLLDPVTSATVPASVVIRPPVLDRVPAGSDEEVEDAERAIPLGQRNPPGARVENRERLGQRHADSAEYRGQALLGLFAQHRVERRPAAAASSGARRERLWSCRVLHRTPQIGEFNADQQMSRELLHAASAAGYLRQASVCRLEPDRARRDEAGSRDATFQAAEDRCSLGRKGGVAIFALMVLFLQGDAGAEYAGVES